MFLNVDEHKRKSKVIFLHVENVYEYKGKKQRLPLEVENLKDLEALRILSFWSCLGTREQ